MDNPLDQAWIEFSVSQPTKIHMSIGGMSGNSDFDLYLYGPDGRLVDWSENWGSESEEIVYLATETGNYYAYVQAYGWDPLATT